METGRAGRCGRIFATGSRGFAPIIITAAISIIAVLAVIGWQVEKTIQQKQDSSSFIALPPGGDSTDAGDVLDDQNAIGSALSATSSDLLSYIGPAVLDQILGAYAQMKQNGTYTLSGGEKAATDLAPDVKAPVEYRAYQTSDLKTDSNISYARMLTYRSDLREALAPLLKNSQPEYEIFALYTSTKDPKYLTQLQNIAQNYRDAQSATVKVVVPRDATPYHIGIVNAMGEFAATLEAMSTHADDPFASVALLRTYNEGEADMLTSFNALTTYYKSKTP